MGLNNIKINNTTNVKTGVVYDISKATGQSYETLSDALGTDGNNVPSEVRERGMSVRFVHTGDNKYVQYRLMSDNFNTTPANWQGVDDIPIAGSENLVKSGGVKKSLLLNSFIGKNGDYSDTHIYGLIPGHRYRIFLEKTSGWAYTEIESSLYIFSINSILNGQQTIITGTYRDGTLTKYYDFVAPNEFDYIRIGGRAIEGVEVRFYIYDLISFDCSFIIIPNAYGLPNIDTINRVLDLNNCILCIRENYWEMSTIWPNNPEYYRAIPLKGDIESSATKIVFNISTKRFYPKVFHAELNLDEILIGGVRTVYGTQGAFVNAEFPFDYTIDGEQSSFALPQYLNTDINGKGIEELKLIRETFSRRQLFSPQSVNSIGFFIGNNNDFCWGNKIYGVIPGETYKIKILTPDVDMSGVTVVGLYRLSVLFTRKDGSTIDAPLILVEQSLPDSVNITIPQDVVNLRIGGRCTLDQEFKCLLIAEKDQRSNTENFALYGRAVPNINTTTGILEFDTFTIVYCGGEFYNFYTAGVSPNVAIKGSQSTTTSWKLLYNKTTHLFQSVTWDSSITEDDVIVGSFYLAAATEYSGFYRATLPFEYTVDGKPLGSEYMESLVKNPDDYSLDYTGEAINIKMRKYARLQYKTMQPSYWHQSMAIYRDIAVFMIYNYNTEGQSQDGALTMHIYNLHTNSKLASLDVPYGNYTIPHCNTSVFGNEFGSENSIAPLLYVSQWNGERNCLVYDITLTEGVYAVELKQVISTSGITQAVEGIGMRDWIVDTDNNFIYSMSYYINSDSTAEGNKTMFVKFALPTLSDGNEVVLTQPDVLDNFELEFFKFFQDKCYNGGKIYIAAGMGNYPTITKLRVLDLTTKQIVTTIPLGDTYDAEPEGFDIYKDKLLMTYGSMSLYNISTF